MTCTPGQWQLAAAHADDGQTAFRPQLWLIAPIFGLADYS